MKYLLACTVSVLFVPAILAERPAGSGVYAIWYGQNVELFDLPFLSGGQAIAQWEEVEPEPNHYDFSALDRQLKALHERGLKATVQINGNRKPAYLFKQVPFYPERLSPQVNDPGGTLMFWHPAHANAYRKLIQALGGYLQNSQYREAILGIRLNFNGFGTEHLHLPPGPARQASEWTTPPGVEQGTDWSLPETRAYERLVFHAYVEHLSPHAYVFVRNGIHEETAASHRDDFAKGRLGWFHTSSEAEPRAGSEDRYQRFYADCRSGQTVAYAEPWASAWGHHGGQTDDRACSPPQWNYWRLLLDLHNGVSFIAAYAADLEVARTGTYRYGKTGLLHDDVAKQTNYRQEFAAAFEFASRYAGYHASPGTSPGAWCAFRGNDMIREPNGKPEKARKLDFYTGDYNFLMERLPDRSEALGTTGPDDQRFGGWARRLPAGDTMVLRLNPAFAAELQRKKAVFQVVFLDTAGAGGTIHCDGQELKFSGQASGRWQSATFPIHSWQGDTLRLQTGDAPLTLHMVELRREADD